MKKVLIRLTGVAILLAAAWGGYRFFQQLPQRQEHVATTKVLRGDVVIRSYTRGELRAVRSVTLSAPNLFSTVQVTRLAPMGSLAHEKDLIVEFDDSERRAQLEETMLEVEQTDEQIKKAEADLAMRSNQDQVDLLHTRYGVRRAELEVQRNDIISAIDAKKNLLTLEEQRRRLLQLQSDIRSRQEQALAQLAVLKEQRNKAMIDVRREQQRIAQAKVLSPMTGLVAIRQNRTGFFMFGQQIPDIREGDTLQPGIPVADVLDLSELELVAKVGELDRANLHEGQDVLITLDAVPDKQFRGKIKGMSGTASSNVFSGDPAKKFDVIFSIDMRQLLTGLGMKPAEVEKIMQTAERNAKRSPAAPSLPGGPGGMAAMPASPGMAGAPGAAPGGMQGQGMAGGQGMTPGAPGGPEAAGGRGGAQPADRLRFQKELEKALGGKRLEQATPEEQQRALAQARRAMQASGGAGGMAGRPAAPGGTPLTPEGGNPLDLLRVSSVAVGQFTEQDRANARLPLPPEEDSQLQVLLRPGLLADIEITVERIPNALHVPVQAVFDRAGQTVVYVQRLGRFEERPVQVARRSESVMVLSGGVKPGELVALADPNAKQNAKKGERKSKGGGAMGTMPGGATK
ncbi:MAG TPA: efflux RND transporter periplasmic adaptor subunit [Bryobacteraceae bacterium]|nr:efflux RND transporter periplasmic adaptor subunit [Bryobacteraceae bacterium]